jgi:hypothetical protein
MHFFSPPEQISWYSPFNFDNKPRFLKFPAVIAKNFLFFNLFSEKMGIKTTSLPRDTIQVYVAFCESNFLYKEKR